MVTSFGWAKDEVFSYTVHPQKSTQMAGLLGNGYSVFEK
jgi:hypothetical protein